MAAVPQPASAGTISERLAAFVAGLRYEAIPTEVRERAKHLALDAVGCALAAAKFDFAPKSLAAIAALAGEGTHPVIGQKLRLPLRDAVLANGLLAHGLDYDDTHSEGVIHLSVSALPTVLAVATELGLHGRDLLVAFVAALETAARIASVARGGFHQTGFHPTGLAGTFGCALAAGKLHGLDAAQLAAAQGVALSVAGGSLEFLEDGAWTKRFHPGWAGVGGIVAAAMAKGGFVAPRAAYEGRFGLYASHLGPLAQGLDFERAARGLGREWETTQVALKPFPICHFSHGVADAALAIHRQAGSLDASRVASITALMPEGTIKAVCEPLATKRRPVSDYDAKFSVPFVVAAALLRGRFGLAELEDAALRDPAILALAAKVGYEIDATSTFPAHYTGELVVRLADGRELRHREAINRGHAERPLTNADIVEKFAQNAGLAVSPARVAAIRDAVLGLDAAPASTLSEILAA